MPFPNEHASRLRKPEDFDDETFRRTSGGKLFNRITVPKTIAIIWGKLKGKDAADDPVLPQALRFPITSWTAAEAKKWLKTNDVKVILFEEASKDNVKKMDCAELVESWNNIVNAYTEFKKNEDHNIFQIIKIGKWVYDEITLHPEITLNKEAMEDEIIEFLNLIEGNQDIRNIFPSDFRAKVINKATENKNMVEVKLQVVDKESTEIQGIMKYRLGYALDSSKAFEGDNIIPIGMIETMAINVRTDENVNVLINKVKPIMINDKIGIEVDKMFIKDRNSEKKPNSSKDIIKAAHNSKVLELSKEMAIELNKCKILRIEPDKEFGVDINKTIPFIKADRFMENGIVYGIVYAANEVDTDGDYSTEPEIRKACWKFMEDQKLNLMHSKALSKAAYSIVECAVAFSDFKINSQTINKGDWYIAVKVNDPALKKMIESGELNAFSIEGKARPGQPIPEMERKKRMVA